MSNEIVQYSGSGSDVFMPIMSIDTAVSRYNSVVGFVKKLMVEGTDYGKIPGTGDKPVLLKPGAEKLSTLFGLAPVFVASEVIEDWTGKGFDGEPMFYYRYKCELYRGGTLIATSEGSCNSRESKYRYRKGERLCPECEQAAIIKGKAEYGGGWLCFAKRGGCGAKFREGDPRIESQEVGRVANPDIADQVNTIQKMAQKRALVAAVLLAVNASEFFTQDIEDLVEATYTIVSDEPAQERQSPVPQQPAQRQQQSPKPATNGNGAQHRQPAPQPTKPAPVDADTAALAASVNATVTNASDFDAIPNATASDALANARKAFHATVVDTFPQGDADDARHWFVEKYTTAYTAGNVRTSSNDLTVNELEAMTAALKQRTKHYRDQWKVAKIAPIPANKSAQPVAA